MIMQGSPEFTGIMSTEIRCRNWLDTNIEAAWLCASEVRNLVEIILDPSVPSISSTKFHVPLRRFRGTAADPQIQRNKLEKID